MIPPSIDEKLHSLAGIRRLEFIFDENHFNLRAFQTPNASHEPTLSLGLIVHARFRPALLGLLRMFPFDVSLVESIVICGSPFHGTELGVDDGLHNFPNLNSLRFVSMDGTALRQWLVGLCRYEVPSDGGPPGSVPAQCPNLATLELCDIRNGAVIRDVLHRNVEMRSRGGVLKEVNLFLVDGWSEADIRALAANVVEGTVTVCLDTGERWIRREVGRQTQWNELNITS